MKKPKIVGIRGVCLSNKTRFDDLSYSFHAQTRAPGHVSFAIVDHGWRGAFKLAVDNSGIVRLGNYSQDDITRLMYHCIKAYCTSIGQTPTSSTTGRPVVLDGNLFVSISQAKFNTGRSRSYILERNRENLLYDDKALTEQGRG